MTIRDRHAAHDARHHVQRGAQEGPAVRARGDLYLFKALAAETEGHYSLFEGRHLPGGGVPPHRHQHDEETFYVLDGTYTFQVGDQTLTLGPGETLHVPRPLPHGFQNTGPTPARMLIVISPGGYHEQYFTEAWEPIADVTNPPPPGGPPDFAKVGAAMARAGLELVDPPHRASDAGRS